MEIVLEIFCHKSFRAILFSRAHLYLHDVLVNNNNNNNVELYEGSSCFYNNWSLRIYSCLHISIIRETKITIKFNTNI